MSTHYRHGRRRPGLLYRLRQWLALRHAQIRQRELDMCIQALEASIDADLAVLGALRLQRRAIRLRICASNA